MAKGKKIRGQEWLRNYQREIRSQNDKKCQVTATILVDVQAYWVGLE